jgi:hypothetical protein
MRPTGRYELKYVVEEDRARAIADYVKGYLRPSPHNDSGPIPGHPVISLYMDSPNYFLYRQVFEGHRNRFKLRIRFYDNDWKHPAVLEIKHRKGDVIAKDRAVITREGVRKFLTEGWPNPSHWPDVGLLVKSKRQFDVYYEFWRLANLLRARGAFYISYVREVFESDEDEELRVTLDRHVHGTWYDGTGRLHVPPEGLPPASNTEPYFIPRDGVILEMKYDERAPRWMYDLAKIFNLRRQSFCKYNACASAHGNPIGGCPMPRRGEPLIITQWTC